MAASYISVPRDLTKVKSKVMFNLTKRQLICFGVAALIGMPSFFLIKQIASTSTAAIGMMVIMMPFFFLAMYEKNGQHLEVILGHLIEATFIRPKERPYKTNNNYAALERYAQANDGGGGPVSAGMYLRTRQQLCFLAEKSDLRGRIRIQLSAGV
ncbi:MAG: PrgI family protein [Lachnospiraceae bacterium]|nr:PrgI family protein [Lachnospiraceae bacterium]